MNMKKIIKLTESELTILIKRIMKEELNDNLTDAQLQVKLISKLLDIASLEGVCYYDFRIDYKNDMVSGIYLNFSSKWYRSSDDRNEMNLKLSKIQESKEKVKKMVSRYLGIKNLYVGSYMEDCDF